MSKKNRVSVRSTLSRAAALGTAVTIAFSTPLSAGADLCQGLSPNDLSEHPMSALAKPALGQVAIDPDFGGGQIKIRRISDVAAREVMKPVYSTVPAWNADESLLLMYHVRPTASRHVLYDGRTYAFIRVLDITPPDLEHVFWDSSNPDWLYYMENTAGHGYLIRYHVSTGQKERLRDFFGECPNLRVDSGADPVHTDWNSQYISLVCKQTSGNWDGVRYLIYSIKDNVLVANVDAGGEKLPPRIGPGGTNALWEGRVMNVPLTTTRKTLVIKNPNEHTSLGRLVNGDDTFNSPIFDPPSGDPDRDHVGNLVTYNLSDASVRPTVFVGPKNGYQYPDTTHISALTFRNPGWVLLSMSDGGQAGRPSGNPVDGAKLLDLELVYVNTNNGDVCRVAHHRSWGKNNPILDYWAEPHAVPSPDGTRILFTSDWGNQDRADAYVVELPGYGAAQDGVAPAAPRRFRKR